MVEQGTEGCFDAALRAEQEIDGGDQQQLWLVRKERNISAVKSVGVGFIHTFCV